MTYRKRTAIAMAVTKSKRLSGKYRYMLGEWHSFQRYTSGCLGKIVTCARKITCPKIGRLSWRPLSIRNIVVVCMTTRRFGISATLKTA
jgi:hypothetical protein